MAGSRHIRCVGVCILASFVWSPAALSQASAENDLTVLAGVAKVDITPETPVRMYGYASRTTESEGVAGRLKASALAIGADAKPNRKDAGDLAVMLAVDCGAVPRATRDEVYRRLAAKHGLRPERFVLCNSHHHSGPNLKGMPKSTGGERRRLAEYAELLTDRLESVALKAIAERRPARLEWAEGAVDFAANRRVLTDGKWTGFGAVHDAPAEHRLPVIRVTAADGALMAVVANYACHNTTLRGNFREIHGDWAGCAQAAIEKKHPGATALITIGCGADSDPCPHGTTALCEQHGQALAAEVSRLLAQPEWRPLPGRLMAKHTVLEIPPVDADNGASTGDARSASLPTPQTFGITVWSFGDALAMVYFTHEVVVDYAQRLRREFRGDRLWISAYTDDVSGYVVSKRLIGEGGYEVRGSLSSRLTNGQPERLQPPMEDRIVQAVGELLPASYRPPRP